MAPATAGAAGRLAPARREIVSRAEPARPPVATTLAAAGVGRVDQSQGGRDRPAWARRPDLGRRREASAPSGAAAERGPARSRRSADSRPLRGDRPDLSCSSRVGAATPPQRRRSVRGRRCPPGRGRPATTRVLVGPAGAAGRDRLPALPRPAPRRPRPGWPRVAAQLPSRGRRACPGRRPTALAAALAALQVLGLPGRAASPGQRSGPRSTSRCRTACPPAARWPPHPALRLHRRPTPGSAAPSTGTAASPTGRRQWAGDRPAPRAVTRTREAGDPAPRLRRPHGARARQAGRRPPGGGRRRRGAGTHRRAAVQGPRRAQGRGDEVRPGPEHLRGGAARGARRPLPGHADQAAGRRSPDAGGDRAQGAGRGPRPALAAAVRSPSTTSRPRRRPSARCTGRSGRTAATSRSRSSTRAPGEALICRPQPGRPGRPGRGRLDPRPGHQADPRRAEGRGSARSSTTASRPRRRRPSPRPSRGDPTFAVPAVVAPAASR